MSPKAKIISGGCRMFFRCNKLVIIKVYFNPIYSRNGFVNNFFKSFVCPLISPYKHKELFKRAIFKYFSRKIKNLQVSKFFTLPKMVVIINPLHHNTTVVQLQSNVPMENIYSSCRMFKKDCCYLHY